jgi:hypothetical protein
LAKAANTGKFTYATRPLPLTVAPAHRLTLSGGVWAWLENCRHERSKYGSTTFASACVPTSVLVVTRTPRS